MEKWSSNKMTHTGLLINGHTSARWRTVLSSALCQLGIDLRVVDEVDLATLFGQHFGVVFLDPSVTANIEDIIRQVISAGLSASVIVYSAVPDRQQAANSYQAGAIAYEPKPNNVDKLCDSLNRVLAGRDLLLPV